MILYEFEGKNLLALANINIPRSQLIKSSDDQITLTLPIVLKAQVLSGKRALAGGVVFVDLASDLDKALKILFERTVNGEKINQVLAEEKVNFSGEEYYLSISYDTDSRGPIVTISSKGGSGVEDGKVKSYPIDPISRRCEGIPKELEAIVSKLIVAFFQNDCLLLEVNPLVKVGGEWVALDAKVKLDDDAKSRHSEWSFSPRLVPGHEPSINEIEAKKIDEADYRGVAGSTYFDLEGDIAVLSSGGGISLTAMDVLVSVGGKPANFTEYSGNPPKEKVIKLTEIVLSKSNLHGLWVVGTVAANFTDIYETLSGVVEGLMAVEHDSHLKIDFPIVIRRGGPRDAEAFEMLKKIKNFNFHLQGAETSITQSAKIMLDLAKSFQEGLASK